MILKNVIVEKVCSNGKKVYWDLRINRFATKASFEALSVVDVKVPLSWSDLVRQAVTFEQVQELRKLFIERRDTSKMDFHLSYEVKWDPNSETHEIVEKLREPRPVDGKFNSETMFGTHESRPVINGSMPFEGVDGLPVTYMLVSAEAKGEEANVLMCRRLEHIIKNGWTSPDGRQYRTVYGYVIDSYFLLLVSDNIRKSNLDELGLHISNSGKAAKRAKRGFAPYHKFMWGTITGTGRVEEGTWFDVEADNGSVYRILDVDMSRLSPQIVGLLEGMNISSIPGFTNQATTVLFNERQKKGLDWNIKHMDKYDMWMFDTKSEFGLKGDRFFLGSVSELKEHKLVLDIQTMVNTRSGAEGLAAKEGIAVLDAMAKVLFSVDESSRRDQLADLVRASNNIEQKDPTKRWTATRAVELGIGFHCGLSAMARRLAYYFTENLVDTDKGRTPLPEAWGQRLYACTNPMMFVNDSRIIDLSRDGLSKLAARKPKTAFGMKVYYCCAPSLPEGMLVSGRSPNASAAETVILWNEHLPELMRYQGDGRIFFGADGGEIMQLLNGGDFDDQVWVIAHPNWVRRMAQARAEYPLQPKFAEAEASPVSKWAAINDEANGSTSKPGTWDLNVLRLEFMRAMEYQYSLGAFINDISLDNMLSGEGTVQTVAALKAGKYFLPKGFAAPTRDALLATDSKTRIVPVWFHKHIPVDYKPTKEDFVKLCITFMEVRPQFLAKVAASNSDKVIDYLIQGSGNKALVGSLVDMAKESRFSLVFPEITANRNRVPYARRIAGNYLIVRTEACEAIHQMRDCQDKIMAEARRMEWQNKKQLPVEVLEAYVSSEVLDMYVDELRTWWAKSFMSMKDENGVLHEDAYNRIANGWDELVVTHDKLTGLETSRKSVHHLGLRDFYYNQFNMGTMSAVDETGKPYGEMSTENRRQILVSWLSAIYSPRNKRFIDKTDPDAVRSVGDGVPNFMFNELFDIFEELGLTGQVCFMTLSAKAKEFMKSLGGSSIPVEAIDGHVYKVTDFQQLSKHADPRLPDGHYTMSPAGVIVVKEASPELRSDWKLELSKALAEGDASAFSIF